MTRQEAQILHYGRLIWETSEWIFDKLDRVFPAPRRFAAKFIAPRDDEVPKKGITAGGSL
jgi:hypothetical protein